MNELLYAYKGPVLLSQGELDPLNDAKARAVAFKKIRKDISVDLLPLGHCPMDEGSEIVAKSIVNWFKLLTKV
jgi:pimeloyl-ACP methyl ester carboxylesterase